MWDIEQDGYGLVLGMAAQMLTWDKAVSLSYNVCLGQGKGKGDANRQLPGLGASKGCSMYCVCAWKQPQQ